MDRMKNILLVVAAVLLITVFALWRQNSSLKEKNKQLVPPTPVSESTVKIPPPGSADELKALQDQLNKLLQLQKQLQ